jgi:hypothetical protein
MTKELNMQWNKAKTYLEYGDLGEQDDSSNRWFGCWMHLEDAEEESRLYQLFESESEDVRHLFGRAFRAWLESDSDGEFRPAEGSFDGLRKMLAFCASHDLPTVNSEELVHTAN